MLLFDLMGWPKGYIAKTFDAKYRREWRAQRIADKLCLRCGNPAIEGFQDCQSCIDSSASRVQNIRDSYRTKNTCISCKKPWFGKTLRCQECGKGINKKGRERTKRLKLEVLSFYGKDKIPQCCWRGCDIADIDMLTLDHVNNDGAKHRREYTKSGRGGGSALYFLITRNNFPEGYQTLCANHNLKKHIMGLNPSN